jgi:hypothetical protein
MLQPVFPRGSISGEQAAFGFAVTTLEPIKFKARWSFDATRAREQELREHRK